MKKNTKRKMKNKSQDLTYVYIALLALGVIVIIFFLAYLSKMSTMPQGTTTQTAQTPQQNSLNGVQTATITILPQGSTQSTTGSEQNTSNQATLQSRTSVMVSTGSMPAGNLVQFKIDHFKKLALQPLQFNIFNSSGKAYVPTDLKDLNGNKVELVIVAANLRQFLDLYPTYQNGAWNTLANLPNPGTYYVYTVFNPVNGSSMVLRSTFVVQTETANPINYPGLTPQLFAITKNFKAQLALSEPVVLQQTVFDYHVMSGSSPVTLSSYLGALGSVIVFQQGAPDSFMHINPLSSGNAANGQAQFMTTFTKGGRYTAFAQFKIGNSVYVFPITFDISG